MKRKHLQIFLLMVMWAGACCNVLAQNVSIAPSRLYYKVSVGDYKTQVIKITNSSTATQAFNISFGDFEPNGILGKSTIMQSGESPNSCAKWLTATPSFVEIEPGQTKDVEVLLEVPNDQEANKVKWSTMIVRLTKERKGGEQGDQKSLGMGISETFQFVLHIFQTPPSITNKQAEIINFKEERVGEDGTRMLTILARNTGDAILDCASYLNATNLQTGSEERIALLAFTLLPGATREVRFKVPPTLPKGKYSILGVLDYGSRDAVQAAEMDFEVK
ncbi:hypothetical protein [Pontibacter harenae]|uniref:hypothetical protein n=1 Tax=Pontibacter harenae TaxID=2894083 RepID=UPI001E4822B1|nr:hypothetical protein [Pontibacter harenae]MCC9166469.1 hypothetical protein [Pontibacter harenae]